MKLMILNQGAHPIKGEQFPDEYADGELVPVSKGNLDFEDFKETGIEAVRQMDSEDDVLVLTGPGMLQATAVACALVKFPQGVKVAQFDFATKSYSVSSLSHNELREALTE